MSRLLACVAALSYATIMMGTFGLLTLVMIFFVIKVGAEGLMIFGILAPNWPIDHLSQIAWEALVLSLLPACYMSYWLGMKVYRYEMSQSEVPLDSGADHNVAPFEPKPHRSVNEPRRRAA
jgi:hypothetical protein